MTAIVTNVLSHKTSKYGEFHSWWLPSAPVDGEAWGLRRKRTGAISTEGHRRSPDGKYREGGPFFTLRFNTRVENGPRIVVYRRNNYKAYDGRFGVGANAAGLYDYSYMSMHNLSSADIVNNLVMYSSQARLKLRADIPDFSPLVSIGELLQTNLLHIWGNWKNFNKRFNAELRRKGSKNIFLNRTGRYHLAIQFGIMPLVQDIKKFVEAFEEADKRFEAIIRNNGKWVRRRARLYNEGIDSEKGRVVYPNWVDTFPEAWHPATVPQLNVACYEEGGHAVATNTYTKTIEVWAVGKSKFWLPGWTGDRNSKYMKNLKRRLYSDLEWNFDVLYNLTPWSWFLDYYLNLGSFFASFTLGLSEGNYVFDYAYIMRQEIHEDKTVVVERVHTSPTSTGSSTYTITRQGVLKSRYAASLFGFGLTEGDLSPYQLAIMGAIGLSSL